MAAPMTYVRICTIKYAKFANIIGPFHNFGLNQRYRSDKAPEEYIYEEHKKTQEEEINKMRNVSNLSPWLYTKYKGEVNDFSERKEDLKARKLCRKMYSRYGAASGVNPGICWPSKPELDELIKNEQEWEPTFEQLVQKAQEKRLAEQEDIDKRQKLIADRMAKMDNLIREYKKQQAKKPEEELRQKRKKEELLEAAEEYYGHKIETKGDKYKEFMANRAEADKARRKAEKKSQKKKSSEEALRHVLEKAGGKEKKQTASNVESDDEV